MPVKSHSREKVATVSVQYRGRNTCLHLILPASVLDDDAVDVCVLADHRASRGRCVDDGKA